MVFARWTLLRHLLSVRDAVRRRFNSIREDRKGQRRGVAFGWMESGG